MISLTKYWWSFSSSSEAPRHELLPFSPVRPNFFDDVTGAGWRRSGSQTCPPASFVPTHFPAVHAVKVCGCSSRCSLCNMHAVYAPAPSDVGASEKTGLAVPVNRFPLIHFLKHCSVDNNLSQPISQQICGRVTAAACLTAGNLQTSSGLHCVNMLRGD